MATLNYFDKVKGEWVAIALGGGGDLSDYATNTYVNGELAKVYSKEEVDAAIAAAPSGVVVYEQAAEPANGNTGDLWLVPSAIAVAGQADGQGGGQVVGLAGGEVGSRLTIEDVDREIENALTDPTSLVLKELKETIVSAVFSRLYGHVPRTPDVGWQETTQVAGAGKVEASVRGGVLRLRGTVSISTAKWTHVRTLPTGFPRPATAASFVCVGADSGVAERLVIVFIGTDGKIQMSPMGNHITDFNCDNIAIQMP